MPEWVRQHPRRGTIAALRCWQGSTLGRLLFRTSCRSVQGLGPCADAPRVCGPGGRACTASKGRDEPEQWRGPADAARAACRGRQCRAGRNGGRGAGVAGTPARAASLRQMNTADFFFLPLKAAPGKDSALFLHAAATQPAQKEKSRCPRGSSYRPAPTPRGAKRGHRSEAAPHKGAEPTPRRSGRAPPRNGAAAGRTTATRPARGPRERRRYPRAGQHLKSPPQSGGCRGDFK